MGHGLGVVGQGHEQAIYPVVEKRDGVGFFFFLRLGGLADDQIIAFTGRDIFHPGDYRGHEITVDAGNDHTYSIGALGSEIARKVVRAITHFLGEVGNSLLRFFADYRIILQCAAYRGDRNIQLTGKIIYGNFFLSAHTIVYMLVIWIKIRFFLKKIVIGYILSFFFLL